MRECEKRGGCSLDVTHSLTSQIDVVLVPSYDGGMENWGHILLSSSIALNADDAHLTHLIAHELAHHWIGNAVTVDTWSHICLQVCCF